MRIALAIAAAAVILAAPGSASSGFDLVSWADFEHAWGSLEGTVYATSDAGKTWRPVFSGGAQIFRIERTSLTSGIVVSGNQKPETFWTRDAGRHWFRGTEAYATAVGHAGELFAANGAVLQQLRPWPPRASPRCRGPWWSSAFGGPAKGPKNVCSVPTPVAVHKVSVLTLTRGELAPDTLEPVPGGIAGVATDGTARGRPLSVVVYRLGRGVEVPLPNAFPQDTGFSALQLYVSWPNLLLRADAATTHVVWNSDDGGDTWSTLTR